jgi:hypothetical protein
MTGYVRQSAATIAAGLTIASASFNNEFNALATAFDSVNGHIHDGSTGGGGAIPPLGLNGIGTTGMVVALSTSTFTTRQLVAGTNVTITYPDGVAGNPVINSSANGFISIPGVGFFASPDGVTSVSRQLVAGTGISITNPQGIAGNPVISATGGDPLSIEVFL